MKSLFLVTFLGILSFVFLSSPASVSAQVAMPCALQQGNSTNNCVPAGTCYLNDQPQSGWKPPAGATQACENLYNNSAGTCPTFVEGNFYNIGSLRCVQDSVVTPSSDCSCTERPTGTGNYYPNTPDSCDSQKIPRCSANGACTCITPTDPSETSDPFVNNMINGPDVKAEIFCGLGKKGINTALGCLMAGEPKALIEQILGWGVSVGGGVAFLMIVFAGFQMATAAGDPKRVQAARELMTSAIAGLILIVLSVVLLNFFGVNILKLDGLGFKL